jgi:hypothetical protein
LRPIFADRLFLKSSSHCATPTTTVARLKMSSNIERVSASPPNNSADDASVYVYGAEAIGIVINATAVQVRRFYKNGLLKDAVAKFGHRTFIGHRERLKNLKLVDVKKK